MLGVQIYQPIRTMVFRFTYHTTANSDLIATGRRSQDSDNSQSNATIHIYTVRRGIGMDGYTGVIETTLIENIS